ncbi:MFS transporter [Streptomyces sp. NPDC048606]|uniref:MFS transporter n=1 Tax=Streptomyces sp. NPDC048606 TaxID=3154726 RepID=UPI003427A92F
MLLLGTLIKIPLVAVPLVLTLHLTTTRQLGYAQAGLVIALWTVGAAAGSPLLGRRIDRHGLRPVLVVATVAQALFWATAAQLPYAALLVAAPASGLVIVQGSTISRLAILGLVPEENRHTAFAVDSMLTTLSYLIGPALGVVLATRASGTLAVQAIGLLLVLACVAVIVRDPRPPARADEGPSGAASPPPRRWLGRGLVATCACALAAGMFASGAELGIVGILHRSDQTVWLAPVLMGVSLGSLAGGLVYGTLERRPPAALTVAALGLVTLPVGLVGGVPWLAVALLPAALLNAPAFASTAAAAGAFAVDGARASALGLYSTATAAGAALGGPLVGTALDHGGPAPGFAALGAAILLVSLAAWPRDATARQVPPDPARRTRDGRRPTPHFRTRPEGEPVMSAAPRVVLVDPYIPAVRLAEQFRQAGAVLIRVQSTREVPEVYRSSYVVDGYADTIVHEDLATTVARLSAHGPTAVLAGGELGVPLADALAEALGLPGNGVASSEARRDKYVMIETIKRAGVPGARQLLVEDEERLADWHRDLGGRVVVKPLRSSGNDHVFFCDTPEESAAAYRRTVGTVNVFSERNTGVVAQEYLRGTEYMVNTVSRDGHHRICEIWRTTRLAVNGVSDLLDGIYLMARRGEVQDALAAYCERVLDALDIRQGPAHLELKLTDDGPRLVEVGARLSGGRLPSHAQLAIGESQLDWTVRACLDPEGFHRTADEDYRRTRHVGHVALVSPVEGVLKGYRDLDAIRSLDSFHDLQVYLRPGDRVSRTVDDMTYAGSALLVHETEEAVLRDANTIRFLDGPGLYDVAPDAVGERSGV